ncbi:MAG: hypothetical protein ACLTCI_07595 [[Clostridium] nexile]
MWLAEGLQLEDSNSQYIGDSSASYASMAESLRGGLSFTMSGFHSGVMIWEDLS